MRLVESPARSLRISLTPLIDVVFILLLFFMLSTQFSRQQVIELAVVADLGAQDQAEQHWLRLHLSADGSISINETRAGTIDTLPTHPLVVAAIAESTPIRLDAGDDVALQELIAASDTLHLAGATLLSLSALH
ncbi:ExbD/TolR family protein [Granulosicoccus sp. 3-233]|uniref:ExbD/TolR family protein n=1 Tax=Granulosicoccus sp. 3-233 TaxID=3417969 RepID=UPI003D33AEA1